GVEVRRLDGELTAGGGGQHRAAQGTGAPIWAGEPMSRQPRAPPRTGGGMGAPLLAARSQHRTARRAAGPNSNTTPVAWLTEPAGQLPSEATVPTTPAVGARHRLVWSCHCVRHPPGCGGVEPARSMYMAPMRNGVRLAPPKAYTRASGRVGSSV